MHAGLPRLRSDLDRRLRTTGDGTSLVLKDPISGEFYSLREVERFVVEQLDGETPLDAVQRRAEQRFGARLPPDALGAFIQSLKRNGLLETGDRRRRRGARRRRLAGNLLYLRYRLVDPDRMLDRLVRRTRFFFTPSFVALSVVTIFVALGVSAFNAGELARGMAGLAALSTLPLLIVTIFVVMSLHELAHGLTCKHFGGEVREMGFLLLYLQPAFYCNVSDAWLFPEKSKRLWVGFAGPYFEVFLWAVATLAWRVTDAGALINQVALATIGIAGLRTLFNFNPLIKLDGYYLLSDWLDMPNLRAKSFAYVGERLRRLDGAPPAYEPPARERRIYLWYGVTAWVFSIALLSYIGMAIGGYLIVEQQRLLFVLFVGLLAFVLAGRFGKLSGRKPAWQSLAEAEDLPVQAMTAAAEPASAPNPAPVSAANGAAPVDAPLAAAVAVKAVDEEGATASVTESADMEQEKSAAERAARHARRRKRAVRRWSFRLAGLAAVAVLLFFGRMELRVAGPVSVLPLHNADARTAIDGVVEEVHVDEGQTVRRGEVIARLSDREHRAELQKNEAEMHQSRAKLRLLVAGPTVEQIDVARSDVAAARDRLGFARAKRVRTEMLVDRQLVPRIDLDAAREQEAAAENELASAQSKLEILLRGSRPEEIDAARAELARLEAQRRYLEGQLQRVEVRSPANGVVTTPSRQLRELVRQAIPKGGLVAKVHELETVTVEALISEKEAADIEVGQRVAIKTRAYPDRVFHGKVVGIAVTAQNGGGADAGKAGAGALPVPDAGGPTIRVTTEIDNRAGLLKPGMTGMAKIYCGERRIVDLVVRRLSRTFRVEFWSWW
jgi:multidrug resistance efflux pump